MNACRSCGQLHRESRCPFCRTPVLVKAMNAVGGVVTTLVLTACYGAPVTDGPPPPTPTGDTAAPATGDTGREDTGDTAEPEDTGL